MHKLSRACVSLLAVGFTTGCLAEIGPDIDGAEESIAEATDGLAAHNSLIPNSLIPNSLAPEELSPAALSPTTLSPSALAALQDPGPEGDAVRDLVHYAAECALEVGQSFVLPWTDAAGVTHQEVYEGMLGLAPEWATGSLSDEKSQRLVSGCLAARVNWYGLCVWISLRSGGAPLAASGSSELAAYPHVEGAFWGNLFVASPYLNACHRPENAALARAEHRDCAVGHVDDPGQSGAPEPCGLIALAGPCGATCKPLDSLGQYYPSCVDRPGQVGSPSTAAVITVGLQ